MTGRPLVPQHTTDCAVCGGRFLAKTRKAKFCSDRCRKRAARAPEIPEGYREGAPIVHLAAAPASALGFTGVTQQALIDADRRDTYQGEAAMFIARLLDSGLQDTGSSIAALVREYKATMASALEGAHRVEDPVDNLLARQAGRKASRSA